MIWGAVRPVSHPGDETEALSDEDYLKIMKFNKPGDVIHVP